MSNWTSADNHLQILTGDCRERLADIPDGSVHCVVTSPPYWGLRDYGCEGQIGLEETPDAYVARMVEVFREVRRVLRSDGTCWVNLGSSYAGGGGFCATAPTTATSKSGKYGTTGAAMKSAGDVPGFKPKDMVPIPWMVAMALRADGWYLRQDIIWHKPNPMPESVTDRCTKAHEYLFLLTKSARYFYDAEAVKEEVTSEYSIKRNASTPRFVGNKRNPQSASDFVNRNYDTASGRNRRSVWTITTKPYPGSHFAVMPPALVEPCIKAGSSEEGCCPVCGGQWERVVKRETRNTRPGRKQKGAPDRNDGGIPFRPETTVQTLGWQPTCQCPDHEPTPCTILDPFGGSGTTAEVALKLGRRAILIELNPEYIHLAKDRAGRETPSERYPLFAGS